MYTRARVSPAAGRNDTIYFIRVNTSPPPPEDRCTRVGIRNTYTSSYIICVCDNIIRISFLQRTRANKEAGLCTFYFIRYSLCVYASEKMLVLLYSLMQSAMLQ